MNCFDLHCHSTASDGSLSPKALVERAIAQQVDMLALTDHDGTEGIEQAQLAASGSALTLVPGVEISTTWQNQTIHIVGLNIDPNNEQLRLGLAEIRQKRSERAVKIAEKLEKAGIDGAYQGACQFASPVMIGRVHFARFLVESGHADNINQVFKRFLVNNKPGYVSTDWVTIEQAVNWINDAGGQAVIAHPGRYKMTATKLKRLITEFKQAGGVGIEVISGRQHPEEVKTLAKLANQFELLASRGSDFHSPDNVWVELGKLAELPQSVTPIWHNWPSNQH